MNRFFRYGVLALVWMFPLRAAAAVQLPEVLVVGSDTLSMFAMPLESAPGGVRQRLTEMLEAVGAPRNTACVRGYVGHWRLERGALWLESIRTCRGALLATGAELMPQYASGSCAWTPWVNGEIRCGSGEQVHYAAGRRYFAHERSLTVRGGCVVACRNYENRSYGSGFDPDENARRLRAEFDAARFGRVPSEVALNIVFAADSSGRVVRVDRASLIWQEAGATEVVEDLDDPRLREALRAFRTTTRWNGYRIADEWLPQQQVLIVYPRD